MTIGPLVPVLDDGRYFEAPRWHAGRLWLVDAGARTLLRLGTGGGTETICSFAGVPAGLGFLPTGEPIVTDMHGRALVRCVDGNPARHADLSALAGTIDDMTIGPTGRAYVGDLGFDLKEEGIKYGAYGRLILIDPGFEPRVVADGLDFPNGIALSADGRQLAVAETNRGCVAIYSVHSDGSLFLERRIGEFKTPDGICFDCEGALWVSLLDESSFVRVSADGHMLHRISVPGRRGVACALGGPDRKTLFCVSIETQLSAPAGSKPRSFLECTVVDVPGEGWP